MDAKASMSFECQITSSTPATSHNSLVGEMRAVIRRIKKESRAGALEDTEAWSSLVSVNSRRSGYDPEDYDPLEDPTNLAFSSIRENTSTLENLLNSFTALHLKPEFYKFVLLPAELREAIWRESLPGPRILETHWELSGDEEEPKLIVKTKSPVAWRLCHESRLVVLRALPLHLQGESSRYVHFDPGQDTVYFSYFDSQDLRCVSRIHRWSSEVLRSIRHVAIDFYMLNALKKMERLVLGQFKALKTLTVVAHDMCLKTYHLRKRWRFSGQST